MKLIVRILALVALLFTSGIANEEMGGGHPMPQNPEFKAAMDTCMQSSSKDSSGRPNREEVESCMEEKGFEKPQGTKPPQR